ncbi:GON-4-like protein isoform X2 [Pogona vitticeps]
MGPPPPPKPKQSKDSTFMEKLHAVDEELASSPVCMESFQPLEDSLIALRTRSKRPLKDVPLGQLEAELRAPDITPDMYDPNTADDEEWKRWLSGLMNDDVGNEDEADDDDDPEYNFLEDLDEPDTEDFRNDRAVRITKKEVNELMEELFETFQDEMGFSNVEDEGPEDEDGSAEARPNFNTPQVLRFEEPLANLLNEQHRTVKEQLEQLRMKKSAPKLPLESERAKLRHERPVQTLTLDTGQKKRLMQQMQQHVQLLTQVHLLSSANPSLSSEAGTARLFLTELDSFAQSSLLLCQPHGPDFQTAFQPCNLKEALRLIQDFHANIKIEGSPRKAVKKNGSDFACLPKQLAWIFATRRVFMYPELLPTCSLKAKTPRDKIVFTKGEDNLLALGLKHFEGTEFPKPLISKYLLTTKTAHQLTVRIKNLNMNRVPDNILKYYKMTKQVPALPRLCEELQPGDWTPPIEREEHRLPFWLKASRPFIQEVLEPRPREASHSTGNLGEAGMELTDPRPEEKYPLRAPEGLQWILRPLNSRFCRKAWRRPRPAATKPLPVRPGLCLPSAAAGGSSNILKMATKHPPPEALPSKAGGRVPRLIQPAPLIQPLPGVQHLSLQPAVGPQAGFELRGVFPAQQPDPRGGLAAPAPPNVVPPLPVAFQPKMILPALPASRVRKPGPPRGYQKKRSPRPAPLLKAAPLLHPAPVIFTVPAGAVKVVSIGNSCNVLQPLAASSAAGVAAQPIPITTLLVNPASFPLAVPPAPSVVVTSSSASPLASPAIQDPEVAGRPAGGTASGDSLSCPVKAETEMAPQEPPSCSMTPAEEEDSGPGAPDPGRGLPVANPLPACADGSPADPFSPSPETGELVNPKEESSNPQWEDIVGSEDPLSGAPPLKEELVLGLGQELRVDPPPLYVSEPKEAPSKPSPRKKEEPGQRGPGQCPPGGPITAKETGHSAEGVCGPVAGGLETGGSQAKPEDSSGPGGGDMGPPASHEVTGEKEGPEEEEEEDFEDDLQDEEDEEMSSASEESVLSVPELQETMEKLTWLASERRLSQEGDSEEENSPEENSEPEEEEEEEEEGENPEISQKEDEMADEAAGPGDGPVPCLSLASAVPEVEPRSTPPGENTKAAPGKSRSSHKARAKRGRGRASKDTSKLLLLYDEDILERDPLREQKDLAFAQAYLSQVREALRHQPGKYEAFLRVIYEFENNAQKQTAVDLYAQLRDVLQEWPQLLTDFAAFLLPEQALECGLFEEQQAFEKSRKFLRQLEICFAENPSHHQKIIKVLQSCTESLPQEIMELKTQMWQLLKGHDHLQDEFSVFFDHLRPSASRLGDFEEINWTEEKDYEFDGFEEVCLPDVEEEEEPPKIHAPSKNKRRKEMGGQNGEKEPEWAEGAKECPSCHEGSGDLRMKRSKRRSCGHCGHKAGEGKAFRGKDPPELSETLAEGKAPAEEGAEPREDGEAPPGRMSAAARRTDSAGAGSPGEGKPPPCRDGPSEGAAPPGGKTPEGCSVPGLLCPKRAGDTAKPCPANNATSSAPQSQRGTLRKLPQLKSSFCPVEGGNYAGHGLRDEDLSSGLGKDVSEPEKARTLGSASPAAEKCPQTLVLRPGLPEEPRAPSDPDLQDKGADSLTTSANVKPKGRETWGSPSKAPPAGTNGGRRAEAEASGAGRLPPPAADPKATEGSSPSERFQGPKLPPVAGGRECAVSFRGEDVAPRVAEATVCAKNIKVSSTGEKVVLWTREADRVILTACQERGASPDTFRAISQQLQNKTAEEVAHRFRELMTLFHTACDVSSEDEEDGLSTSNTDPVLSEEEQEETGF